MFLSRIYEIWPAYTRKRLSTITLLLIKNINSESEVLGLGLSVIALNLGMYLGVPTIVVVGIKRRF